MSFVGRMFSSACKMPGFGSSNAAGRVFKNARAFHGYAKRTQIPKGSSKWTVYDELKLFSYTSHLAFFMLLPPVIQMYTTKVEVTRDDTLIESSFESLPVHHGLVLRNVNFLDILQEEKHRLLNLYLSNEPAATSPPAIPSQLQALNEMQEQSNRHERYNHDDDDVRSALDSGSTNDADLEFQLYVTKINDAITAMKSSAATGNSQSYKNIERVANQLVKLGIRNDSPASILRTKESTNNIIMNVFDRLHSLKLHEYEIALLRRLLVSYDTADVHLLNIRQKIIHRYEENKRERSHSKSAVTMAPPSSFTNAGGSHLPLEKIIKSSTWLREYTNSFERFAQLVHMFAGANLSIKAHQALFKVGFQSEDVRESLRDSRLKYSVVGTLDGFGQNKASRLLQNMVRMELS